MVSVASLKLLNKNSGLQWLRHHVAHATSCWNLTIIYVGPSEPNVISIQWGYICVAVSQIPCYWRDRLFYQQFVQANKRNTKRIFDRGEWIPPTWTYHYNDIIMSEMASQITGVSIVCSTGGSGADQRKHQSSASLAIVRGIHRWPVNSPQKKPVTRNMISFDDVIM